MPVQVLDERAQKTPEVDTGSLRRICLRLLTAAGLAHNAVSVVLLDDERMAEYNQRYRNKAGPTNVLSFPALFPQATPAELRADLDDVLIAVATAAREAHEKQAPLVLLCERPSRFFPRCLVLGVQLLLVLCVQGSHGTGKRDSPVRLLSFPVSPLALS